MECAAKQFNLHAELKKRTFSGLKNLLRADDVDSHVSLRQKTTIPIAIGETIYNKYVFQEYIAQGAADILQPDAVRVGGITEWMKVAHTAECFGLSVSPHFLMDLHVHLSAASTAFAFCRIYPIV